MLTSKKLSECIRIRICSQGPGKLPFKSQCFGIDLQGKLAKRKGRHCRQDTRKGPEAEGERMEKLSAVRPACVWGAPPQEAGGEAKS